MYAIGDHCPCTNPNIVLDDNSLCGNPLLNKRPAGIVEDMVHCNDLDQWGGINAVANPYANGLPDEIQQQLARRYADVFRVFLKHRDAASEAERVKEIFSSTATDLGREPYFQGAGLVDLMRAIQSI